MVSSQKRRNRLKRGVFLFVLAACLPSRSVARVGVGGAGVRNSDNDNIRRRKVHAKFEGIEGKSLDRGDSSIDCEDMEFGVSRLPRTNYEGKGEMISGGGRLKFTYVTLECRVDSSFTPLVEKLLNHDEISSLEVNVEGSEEGKPCSKYLFEGVHIEEIDTKAGTVVEGNQYSIDGREEDDHRYLVNIMSSYEKILIASNPDDLDVSTHNGMEEDFDVAFNIGTGKLMDGSDRRRRLPGTD